jgi:dTDP-4-amino-4,6-dideoxygalactose transaminase
MKLERVPFNKPFMTGKELDYIADAHSRGKLSGDGHYTKLCSEWLENSFGTSRALLTHSCTGALEMAAILSDIQPGDEIIMPSYTFVSTANAFVLRGGVPVFVDIKRYDQNIDETQIEGAITPRTKAIVPVHYAGVPCNMDEIIRIARLYGLIVIEDAAQAIFSSYKGKQLGTIGDLGCLSFHETKNVISGEGGALLVNNEKLIDRAEIIREKGTDRSRFFRGQVDKYTWQDLGSSYLPSEINAAFLWAQLQQGFDITSMRQRAWSSYFESFLGMFDHEMLTLPESGFTGNAHMFQIILPDEDIRQAVSHKLSSKNVAAVPHYVPLHSSPAGVRFSPQSPGPLPITDEVSSGILRLPLFPEVKPMQDQVISALSFAMSPN